MAAQVNALSCRNCREKKIRCNKVVPRCNKCETSGSECLYPSRRPRARRARPVTVAVTEDTLRDILERLERLENKQSFGTSSATPEGGGGGDSYCLGGDNDSCGGSTTSCDEDDAGPSAASLSHLVSEATTAARAILHQPSEAGQNANDNALETLETVVQGMRGFRMKEGNHTRVMENVALPKERVKLWIKDFCESPFPIPTPTTLIDINFLLMIPDLLEIPHVKIDNASLICYYNAVYQGMMLDETNPFPERAQYSKFLYHTTLSLVEKWQVEKVNNTNVTIMDFAAAYLVTWMTSEFLDNNLSWKLFCRACSIGRQIGLFDLDRPLPPNSTPPEPLSPVEELTKDRKRALFWQILHTDCMFRHHYCRPAVVQPNTWTVNFPDMVMGTHSTAPLEPIQIIFIVNSRLMLVVDKFLCAYGKAPKSPHVQELVTTLSAEIDGILSNWDIERRFRAATSPMNKWIFADLLFNAFTTLTLLHRVSPVAPSTRERSLQAARASINLVKEMSLAYPNHSHWNMGFVSYYPFVSFFTLFYSILAAPGTAQAHADLALTLWLGDMLASWRKDREELKPFEAVTKALNKVAQHVVASAPCEVEIREETEERRSLEQLVAAAAGADEASGVRGIAGLAGPSGAAGMMGMVGLGGWDPQTGPMISPASENDMNIDFEEFLASPVEYARLLETGIFQKDPHADWWDCL
ncbi:hypothetical protein EDC01DRAFT_653225 [Geopyxis carbonaria]|nr:hypothetical protein EDC01DRAFT_653225 [Geopyxis carbonaria]